MTEVSVQIVFVTSQKDGTKIQIFVKDFIFQFWHKNSTMSES